MCIRDRTGRDQAGIARLPQRQDRELVDAGRRRLRQRNSAHRDRQDSQNGVAYAIQGLRAAERRSRRMIGMTAPLAGTLIS